MPTKIEALVKNEEFIAELEKLQSEEEIIALFKANGVEISADEIKAMMADNTKEELDEKDLEDVAGGSAAYILGYAVGRWLRNRASQGGGRGAFGGGGGGGGSR